MEHAPCFLMALVFTLVLGTPARGGEEAGSRSSFNKGWLFARFGPMPDGSTKDEPKGLEAADLSDALWRRLDLPHDWGIEGPFRADLPGSTGKLPWAGVGWYRKHFEVSADDKGKHFFVDFDGAMSHAKVWLNGHYLGEWPYGYASFRLEMTSHIRFGGENFLAVRLDNPPLSSRWYPGGGIYRNVWLVKTSSVHLTWGGTFVTTPRVTPESSRVHISTEIVNQSGDTAEVAVLRTLSEYGKSSVVASAPEIMVRIPAGRTVKCEGDVDLLSPRLWSLDSPHLYDVRTSIRRNGRVVEEASTAFGIRTAEFTAENGFLLNGRRVPINGVCNHHDLGPLGAAVREGALERQVKILQEMGCNAIRTSHNPPAPELLDLCDRMGIVVLDEAFDCWIKGKTPNDYSTLFKEWHERDIRAFVRRDRNHPCVIAWSAGNEIQEQGDGSLAGMLRDIFHSEDPTRPVTAACNKPEAGFNGFQNSVDLFGYNYQPQRYAQFRQANPSKPLWGTETASCVSTYGEYFFPVSDDKSKGLADFQVSSYDLSAPPWAYCPDVEFEAQDSNPSVAGEFVWTGFDYLGEPTPYMDEMSPPRSSYFGILDLCGFRKDRFYIYQAKWRPDFPMAHILPHWNWPERNGEVTPVHVYTSGDEAELFLNGQSLGRKKRVHYRLRWDDVRYAPGELKVIAYKNGSPWAVDRVATTGTEAGLELSADRSTVRADGRDLVFVRVRIVDRSGLMVPTAGNLVRFKVTGGGAIAAVGNGDPTNHDTFQSDHYKAFHGECLVIIRSVEGGEGEIHVTAESDGLTSANILLRSQ